MKLGRNDPCPCRSGKKFKNCCQSKFGTSVSSTEQNAKSTSKNYSPTDNTPTDAKINQLVTLFNTGHPTEAEDQTRILLERYPNSGVIWKVLGVFCMLQDKDAIPALRKAAELLPDDAEAHNNLANAMATIRQFDDALASFTRALQIKPDYVEAYINQSSALIELGRFEEALASCTRALQIKPDYTQAYINQSSALIEQGRFEEARASCVKALKIKSDSAKSHTNLGSALMGLGRLDEAAISYRQGLSLEPDCAHTHSNLLFCLSNHTGSDAKSQFSEHLSFAEQFETPLLADWPVHSNIRDPERCLQIGIVSGDLLNHAIASFIEPLLVHLSKLTELSLHAYANNIIEDNVSQRLKGYFAHWHSVSGLSEAALAEKIQSDRIDILIDLSGHTAKNRLLTFARKPAPVQASWMGYPGTTGLLAMDYFLADRYLLPPGQFDSQFTEKIVRLPANTPFMPSEFAPAVNALPALNCGYMTFGSFNRPSKINRSVVALWSQLLRALPNSRMLLAAMPKEGKYDTLIEWFAQEGIVRERLDFHGRIGMDHYMELHHQVDICLDTFPYTGGTTTYHALWMGVPTLTLSGSTAAGRPGTAILGRVNLDGFAAHNPDDFIQKGLYWASNLTELSNIRMGMREQFSQSAVGQPALIARGLARALRIMWQRWCSDLPAESFDVSSNEPANDTDIETLPAPMPEQTLHQAVDKNHFGSLQATENFLLAILHTTPEHPEANHNMGLLSIQEKRMDHALAYFLTALDADPTQSQYWISYIDALLQAGQIEYANQILQLAKQQGLQGDDVEALAVRLEANTQVIEQSANQSVIEESLAISPTVLQSRQKKQKNKPDKSAKPALHRGEKPATQETNSLVALFNQARYTEAATLARTMTKRFPQHGFGWKALGAALKLMGLSAEALIPMQKAAELLPNDPEAHNNLGVLLKDLGRMEEACTSYRRTLQINPNHTDAHFNLGRIFQIMGDHDKAESSLRRVLQLEPDYAEAHINLGLTLQNTGRLDDAATSYRRALQIKPNYAEAHNNLGSTLLSKGKLDEAEAAYRQALQSKPNYADAYNNLGLTLQNMGKPSEAEASYRRALQIKPDYTEAYSNMLFCLSHNEVMEAQALLAEHLSFGEQFEAPLRADWPAHTNSRNPERCLQIGIVSGDLYNHAIAFFIEPLLLHLAKLPQLSLHAYANHTIDDSVSHRLRGYFAHWQPTAGLSDASLAEKIRADDIDILIDLSGHTAKNRLLTFARKPAPIQASWMGYPGTTGLQAMDYYLADRYLLPPGQFDDQFTEKIVRMPGNAPFLPCESAPPVNDLPALRNGYVTFGSFNRLDKLSRSVIELWAQLLRAWPDSRMLLGGMPEEGKYDTLIEWFAQEGIVRERLDFHGRIGMDHYMELHHQVDICLDTFPYTGGTTTYHALWMGVPTLTLSGSTAAGRPGTAILGRVNLDGFAAHNPDDFIQKGLYWAENVTELSNIRIGMRERFAQSAVGQPALLAAGVERALRIMWQRWCAGLPPVSFEVTRQELTDTTPGIKK